MRGRFDRPGCWRNMGAVLAGMLLAFGTTGLANADASGTEARASLAPAVLFMLDSAYGDTQNPLYFQVVGEGFRPGEPVTLRASLELPGRAAERQLDLAPVRVVANDYGQVAATIDGGGFVGAGDGFIIRAAGDQHAASIIDLALAGASWTAPGGK